MSEPKVNPSKVFMHYGGEVIELPSTTTGTKREAFDLDAQHTGAPQSDPPLPAGAVTDADEINAMFERAFTRRPDSEFLTSIYTWWAEKAFLTEKQYDALRKFCGE